MQRRRFIQAALLPLVGARVLPVNASSRKLTMQLDWKFNAQFAGLMVADHENFYARRGVAVALEPWQSGMLVTDVVANDPLTLGCAEQNLVLEAQARGAPIVALATMLQASPLALMSLPETEVDSLEDLVGKAVGVPIDGLQAMRLVTGVSGLPADAIEVRQIPYEAKFDALTSGDLAAIQCYAVDEPIEFERRTGIVPAVLPLGAAGHEAYAQVIFAHRDLLTSQPDEVRAFLAATFEGWRLALADIPASAALIVERYAEPGGKYADLDYQRRSLELVADYVQQGVTAETIGVISPERWQRMADRFVEYGILPAAPPLEQSFAAGFWPAD